MRDWEKIVAVLDEDAGEIAKKTAEWREEKGFETSWDNFAEKLMLVVTEVSEVNEGADAAILSFQSISNARNSDMLKTHADALTKHVDNYVEEWIDVMVRVMDLAGSCNIPVAVNPRSLADETDTQLEVVLVQYSHERSREVVRLLSKGMEVFRDIVLEDDEGVVKPQDWHHVDEMSQWLSAVLGIAAGGVNDLGRSWKNEYARKMITNEGRKPKHGRQR